jgi:hypothetical protein
MDESNLRKVISNVKWLYDEALKLGTLEALLLPPKDAMADPDEDARLHARLENLRH